MKLLRISAEGLCRMQSEVRQRRGPLETHQRQPRKPTYLQQQRPVESQGLSNHQNDTTTMKYRTLRKAELVPQNTPREGVKSELQTLADIILKQARRIEKQQRELKYLKFHYERQVSTIKSNAKMLEEQLEKLQGSVHQRKVQQLANHYQEIFSAVEKLQKCKPDSSQPQSIGNHMMNNMLCPKTHEGN